MKTYLSSQENCEIVEYSTKSTYISMINDSDHLPYMYCTLPEEYDVFTNLEPSLFTSRETQQHEMISNCLFYMRQFLQRLYSSRGIICVLPKLTVLCDRGGTITFNWAHSNFRAFMSFDDEASGYDSYCGIVFQEDVDSVSTRTRKIYSTNYISVINELLDLVICNS